MIQINQAGNLLAISDADAVLPLISDELAYWKKTMARRRPFQRGKAGGMQFDRMHMYSVQDGNVYVLAGYLPRIQSIFAREGIEFGYARLDRPDYPRPDYENLRRAIPDMELLYGQDAVLGFMTVADRGTFKAPTGYGKSYLARALCALYPTARIAICGPGQDIVKTTYERLLQVTPRVGRIGDGKYEPDQITVCTAQSLKRLPVDDLDFFIYDEVHTAPAPAYQEYIARIRRPKMFGLSANLTGRADGADIVIEGLFGPKLFEVSYQTAVEHGIVLPIDVHVVDFNSTIAQFSAARYSSHVARRRWVYWRNEPRNRCIADYVRNELPKHTQSGDPQVLILVETLEHALILRRHLPDYRLVYASSDVDKLREMEQADLFSPERDGLDSKAREKIRRDFEQQIERKVIATGCWGTGVDFPALDALVVAGGPASEIVSTQWPGRVSRVDRSGGGKTKGIVVDLDDRGDPWAHERFQKRFGVYKEKGWKIVSQVYS